MKKTNLDNSKKQFTNLLKCTPSIILLGTVFILSSCGDLSSENAENISADSSGTTQSTIVKDKVDSSRIKELKRNFRIEEDEFSGSNKKWFRPKSSPAYTNKNGIYCYFQTVNDKPSNLRFRVQYYNDDWLFFNKIQFSIDGTAYDYVPSNTETDSGNGGYIWEWFDENLTDIDKDFIYALANAKNAKMKFVGRQYFDVKTVTSNQIKGIKETIELYNAMGGNY